MIIIPQIYIKNGKTAGLEGRTSPIIKDDPLETARAMKESGAEVIYVVDLGLTPVGQSPHLAVIKEIREKVGIRIYAGGAFKTAKGIENFLNAGADIAVLGSVAYQQPAFLGEACKKFPGKIAIHIDVKAGRVTIPGYAVAANKTAYDYAEQFLKSGVRHIFYSDVAASGLMAPENYEELKNFCRQVTARITCTSEVGSLDDIEKITLLGVPRLDALVISKPLYDGRIDLRGAITMVNDLSLASGDEPTLAEM